MVCGGPPSKSILDPDILDGLLKLHTSHHFQLILHQDDSSPTTIETMETILKSRLEEVKDDSGIAVRIRKEFMASLLAKELPPHPSDE